MRVLTGIRKFDALRDIFNRDETFELVAVIDDEEFLNPVLVEDLPGFVQCRAFGGRDQIFPRHHLRDFQLHASLESQVAVRDNPHQLAVFGHRDSGDSELRHDLVRIPDGVVGRNRDGVEDHPAF